MDIRIELGNIMHQRRLEAGLTQVQVAEKAGISQPHYARIEKGRYGVSLDVLHNIAQALNCKIDLTPIE